MSISDRIQLIENRLCALESVLDELLDCMRSVMTEIGASDPTPTTRKKV